MNFDLILEDLCSRLSAGGGVPVNERAVVQMLAQAVMAAPAGRDAREVLFEYPSGSEYIDIRVIPDDVLIEVKYHRPIPSGKNRPLTAQFGDILNDVRKLAVADASNRVLVLVTDDRGLNHLVNHQILSVRWPRPVVVDAAMVDALAATAKRHALPHGAAWVNVLVDRLWTGRLEFGHLIAWHVEPIDESTPTQQGQEGP